VAAASAPVPAAQSLSRRTSGSGSQQKQSAPDDDDDPFGDCTQPLDDLDDSPTPVVRSQPQSRAASTSSTMDPPVATAASPVRAPALSQRQTNLSGPLREKMDELSYILDGLLEKQNASVRAGAAAKLLAMVLGLEAALSDASADIDGTDALQNGHQALLVLRAGDSFMVLADCMPTAEDFRRPENEVSEVGTLSSSFALLLKTDLR
jgi:hypothetical protein